MLVLAYAYHSEAAYSCEITKGEKFEPVNGKDAKLDFPCKFNAIRQKCGPWEVRISPGNIYIPPRYILNTVWVEVSKGDDNNTKYWEGRTYTKTAVKYINDAGDVREPFAKKEGNLNTEDVFNYSKSQGDVTATAVDGSFSITFGPYDPEGSKHRNVAMKFTCNTNDAPSGFPDTLCGGFDAKEVDVRAAELGFKTGSKLKADQRDKTYYYTAFTDLTTDQSPNPTCRLVAETMVNECASDAKRVEAINRCYTILYSKPHRECATKFSCNIIDVFYNCVKTVCSDFKDKVSCEALGEAIDMCRAFPDLSEQVATCYKGMFIPINPNSAYYKRK